MSKSGTLCFRDGAYGTHLVQHDIGDFPRLHVHFASSKADEIRETGMRTNGYAGARCGTDGSAHDGWIACMKSAGDASRCDAAQQEIVVTDVVDAEGLADVCVEIDPQAGGTLFVPSGSRDAAGLWRNSTEAMRRWAVPHQ